MLSNTFGECTNLDDRMVELNSRLIAWRMSTQLDEIFEAATDRYSRTADAILADILADPHQAIKYIEQTPKDLLLKAFEEALGDMDNILEAAQELNQLIVGEEDEHGHP